MTIEAARMIEVLNPVAEHRRRAVPLAPRPNGLDGKVLGLLDNGKPNSGRLVAAVAALLTARYHLAGVVQRSKREALLGAAGPLPDEMRDDLARRCDGVVNAIGD